MIARLPPRGLRLPAQRGYCDLCRIEAVAIFTQRDAEMTRLPPEFEAAIFSDVDSLYEN